MSPGADSNIEKEWEEARATLKAFDDRLHDIRKYGFSFVTALLTAQSILIPAFSSSSSESGAITDTVKLGVLSVTLLLIIALRVLEYSYLTFNEAAATRARVLERRLNMELTEVITARYDWAKLGWWATLLYAFFALGVLAIGVFVLPFYFQIVLMIFTIITVLVVFEFRVVQLDYGLHGHEDWTLDRLECKKGESIALTMTNLGDEPVPVPAGEFVFEVIREADWTPVHVERATLLTFVAHENNFTWFWDTGKNSTGIETRPGVYRVFPSQWDPKVSRRKAWSQPLRKKIVVTA